MYMYTFIHIYIHIYIYMYIHNWWTLVSVSYTISTSTLSGKSAMSLDLFCQ